MKSKLSQLTQRVLLVCALCPVPLVAMATSVAADESFESLVHARQTLMIGAGRAGDKFSFGAVAIAERDGPQSFAHAARDHTPSPLAGGKALSHGGVLSGDVSPFSALSQPSSESAIATIATPVPEPGTYALMLAGLAGLGFVVRARRGRR